MMAGSDYFNVKSPTKSLIMWSISLCPSDETRFLIQHLIQEAMELVSIRVHIELVESPIIIVTSAVTVFII